MKSVLPVIGAIGTLLLAAGYLALTAHRGGFHTGEDVLVGAGPVATMIGFGGVGFLLARHRPGQPIGWLLGGFGMALAARSALEEGALAAIEAGRAGAAAWLVLFINVLMGIALGLLVSVIVLFPHGSVPGRRWRAALVAVWGAAAVSMVLAPIAAYEYGGISIPALITIDGAAGIAFPLSLPGFTVALAAMGRIVLLMFRGTELERRQVRWPAYVLAVTLALLAASPFVRLAADLAGLTAAVGIPVAIGIAVTQYRLYDIDRIISRSVSYALVAGALALLFSLGAVWLPQQLPTSNDALAVAATTLVVFVLFNPLRGGVLRWVDRRFHRAAYDPDLVSRTLAEALRDVVHPSAATSELVRTAAAALHPASIAVWTAPARNGSGTVDG